MNQLAIFDIDGTLTATNAVDDECYRDAVAEALGVAPAAVNWSGADHITDIGILNWLCATQGRSVPSTHEIERIRTRFVDRLISALHDDPARFNPVAGAAAALRAIDSHGWRVAAATGSWGPSARLKLGVAQLPVPSAVLSCADDATSRVEIVGLARRRAERFYGCEFARVVTIGDGPWDVEAAAALGLPFVGIATDAKETALRDAGADIVLPDYADIGAFTEALRTAPVPRPARSRARSGARVQKHSGSHSHD